VNYLTGKFWGGLVMLKLMSVLAAAMFVTLLIGGENNGQVRQGLIGVAPMDKPVVAAPVAEAEAKTDAAPADVTLANFTPVTVQKRREGVSAQIAGAFVMGEKVAVVEPEPAAVAAATDSSVMFVSSNSVNVRGGPSTDYAVVGRLTRAEAVTVVAAAEEGWVQIRIEGDGVEGFVAARLLTDIDPNG
jgi:hypothetical protein